MGATYTILNLDVSTEPSAFRCCPICRIHAALRHCRHGAQHRAAPAPLEHPTASCCCLRWPAWRAIAPHARACMESKSVLAGRRLARLACASQGSRSGPPPRAAWSAWPRWSCPPPWARTSGCSLQCSWQWGRRGSGSCTRGCMGQPGGRPQSGSAAPVYAALDTCLCRQSCAAPLGRQAGGSESTLRLGCLAVRHTQDTNNAGQSAAQPAITGTHQGKLGCISAI